MKRQASLTRILPHQALGKCDLLVLRRVRWDHEPPALFPDGPAVRKDAFSADLIPCINDDHVLRARGA